MATEAAPKVEAPKLEAPPAPAKVETPPAVVPPAKAPDGGTPPPKDEGKTPTPTADAEGQPAGDQPKAPDKYTLTAPEGGRASSRTIAAIEQVAKENGWSNDQAQAALEAHAEALDVQSERYLAETKADPTYGGANLEKSTRLAQSVIDKIRPEGHPRRAAFLSLLNEGGYNNQLEVIAFLADLGTHGAEDRPGGGNPPGDGNEGKEMKDILYPNQK